MVQDLQKGGGNPGAHGQGVLPLDWSCEEDAKHHGRRSESDGENCKCTGVAKRPRRRINTFIYKIE